MYKDDYISAFGKLAPSEGMDDRHAGQMRAAEAEQEVPGAAGRPALRVSGKKTSAPAPRGTAGRGGGGALAVPAAWFWGVAMRPAGSAAPAQYSCRAPGARRTRARRRNRRPRRRSAGHSGHGKLCGGSAGDNGGRAGRRAQGGQAAVRRGRRRYGHGRYYRPDGCGPGGREPHL